MDDRDGYRRAAAECLEAARQTIVQSTRIELLVMALRFTEMAKAGMRRFRRA